MREGIHPKYEEITFTCACGAKHKTRSTTTKNAVAICSNCHPFFTGKQKFVDTAGRVEKFMKKYAEAAEKEKQPNGAKSAAKPAVKAEAKVAAKAAPKAEAKAPAKAEPKAAAKAPKAKAEPKEKKVKE